MAQGIPARLTAAEGRQFGFTVGTAFVALAALARWRGHAAAASVLLAVGGALIAGGLVVPSRLGPIQRGWMSLAHAISKVTTPIVMGAVYFAVLAPVGVVMRALGRNPMVRQESSGSFWVTRTANDGRGTMEHQF